MLRIYSFPPKVRGYFLYFIAALLLVLTGPFYHFEKSNGYAYILQGPHILELMVHTLAGAKTMLVEQRVTVEDDALAEHPLEFQETLRYFYPDHFRSDSRFEETRRIFVLSQGKNVIVIDGVLSNEAPSSFDLYKDPLLYHSRRMLHKTLLTHDVDVGTTSLGRYDGRIAYVIGAQYPNDAVSQLWVEKDRFLPLRWLNVDPFDKMERLEFIYRNWRKFGEAWYPMRVETYYHDKLIRVIHTMDVQVDVEFSPELFDTAYLQSVFSSPQHPLEAPPSDSEVDDLQRAIEQFQKKFE